MKADIPCPSFLEVAKLAEQVRWHLPSKRRFADLGFGYYRSNRLGQGSDDFAELREYQEGDDERLIDWNASARTGVLHIRQYYAAVPMPIWLLLDTSGSMRFRVAWSKAKCAKHEYAARLAFLLASALMRGGAKVGIMAYSQTQQAQRPILIPPHHNPSRLPDFLGVLQAYCEVVERAPDRLLALLQLPLNLFKQSAGIVLLSDFVSNDPWAEVLTILARHHQVFAVRVVDPWERVLPTWGAIRLYDLETGEACLVDTDDPEVHLAYARQVWEQEQRIAAAFLRAGVPGVLVETHRPIAESVYAIITLLSDRLHSNPREVPAGLQVIT